MPKGYKQLTYEQRCQIYALKKRGFSYSQIANDIQVHRSTISRECSRNKGKRSYRFKQAQEFASNRRHLASKSARRVTLEMLSFIQQQLNSVRASPQQISGRMSQQGMSTLSHETIYRLIYRDKKKGGAWHTFLRRKGKKYNRRSAVNAGRGCIPGRVDIDQRPSIVEEKSRFGDIELDTIIGANHQGVIVSMVDRASKLTKLVLLKNRKAQNVTHAISHALKPYMPHIKTHTADNGKEFADHATITKNTHAKVYFAKPYHSWQSGLNEHTNGLIRQYFPKNTNFLKITAKDVQNVEDALNNRPRKILNFKTPNVVVQELIQISPRALHC